MLFGRFIFKIANKSLSLLNNKQAFIYQNSVSLVTRNTTTMTATPSTTLDPPIALQKLHKVPFGAVEGENRGERPFFPLRYRDDPWFWLRDDDRKNEEVLAHLRKENFSGSHIIHFLLAVILYFNWQLQTISLMIDIFSTDLLSKLAKKNNDSSAF